MVPPYIDTMIANMQEGVSLGVTTSKILVEEGLKQIQALLVPDYKESVFYQPLLTINEKILGTQSNGLKVRYESMIQNEIYPAYQKLERFVREGYLRYPRTTDGLCEIPGGKEFYRALVCMYTTTDLTPDQIRDMGCLEVKRIQKEFECVKVQMGFKGGLHSFFESLKEKNQKLYPFHSAQEVLDAYLVIYKKVMQKIPEYFHLMPKASFEIQKVEEFKGDNVCASYQNPSEDGLRPGIFWVPISCPGTYPYKTMETLFLHEAIPGHHFQISIQQ